MIVARPFPGPGSGGGGLLAVDRNASFHGTHVAGIAAGDAGTTAPAGVDHPTVTGLSGVAPRAWLGNYRVFNVPTPVGHVANSPEIAAAFEQAVRDGMDVINFSGGGTEGDPANDVLIQVVDNVAKAGVVPVIAAGNDRDTFGLGSVGSPGTAPDAVSVAAVSNAHVFSPVMTIVGPNVPKAVQKIPYTYGAGTVPPLEWATTPHSIVDIGSLPGTTRGGGIDPFLCGPPTDPNNPSLTPLASGSMRDAVVLASRGHCSFFSKAVRAFQAGAAGLILVDNRAGEANGIPLDFGFPALMISDLDGARLRAYLQSNGSRAQVLVSRQVQEVEGRPAGVITSFSSAGPTDFTRALKPDVAAPGGSILSSTLTEFTGDDSPFAVFDGTSMATPHVAGAVALLLQLHRDWNPQQVKSALVSTAGPAWQTTAQTQEASVLLEGGGLVNLPRASDPRILTDPASLSFRDLNVNHGAQSRGLLVRISDAGNGAGDWSVSLLPQAATAGATVDVPSDVLVPPGGDAQLAVVARAPGGAAPGDNYGFIVLQNGDLTRRIPYYFSVQRPALESLTPLPLKRLQTGSTAQGPNRVSIYCCPAEPFGPPPDYFGTPMKESGTETLYVTEVDKPVANAGVAVIAASGGAQIDPWWLGSPNEQDVQGATGTPVNVNNLLFDFQADIGVAGTAFPRVGRYYVSVDSGSDFFTGQSLPGQYILQSWQNDVTPPKVQLLTKAVAAGRPTLVARVTDRGSGIDPFGLVVSYRTSNVGAALYDPASGIAVFGIPQESETIPAADIKLTLQASDNQESKNINTVSENILPNTTIRAYRLHGQRRPALTWVSPRARVCVRRGNVGLIVVGSSTKAIRSVRFFDGKRAIGTDRTGDLGLYAITWKAAKAKKGTHVLRAVLTGGGKASAIRRLRICG